MESSAEKRRWLRWKLQLVGMLVTVAVLLVPTGHHGAAAADRLHHGSQRSSVPAETEVLEAAIGQRINAIRAEQGLPLLVADQELARLAREHSRHMAEEEFFAHADPAGRSLVDRLQAAGISYRAAGENIFRSANVSDPVRVAVQGWMQSPGHRANILGPQFRSTGVGIWRQGNQLFFTQVFLRAP
ncbi:MAG: CAP domain-containing protein [Desulfuromonadales bacterium]|nr:CAP domain-containing protein [Desulfuromonadales bacterium]